MRAVFDLDDTISVHRNRDFPNAIPISATIEKMKVLKKDGWEIYIYSSRGQNSCKGDLALIEKRNREQVEEWLVKYDVPYDRLLFGKPLGDVYIDDKGTNLNDFLQEQYEKLHGNSHASVYRAGKRVLKQSNDARKAADWYEEARKIGLHVPVVNSVVLDRIDIEYIEGEPGNQRKLCSCDLYQILSQIMLMSLYKIESSFDMEGYLSLVKERLGIAGWENRFEELFNYFRKNEKEIKVNSTFSHGDLTLSNTIFTPSGIYLIDPSPRTEYSTFLNDFAKLRFSLDGGEQLLHGGDRPPEYDARLSELSDVLFRNGWYRKVSAMEAVHWIRMLGYFKGEKAINLIWKKAKELEAEL